MATRYWFGRKRYGYGWVPITWQGWTAVAVLVAGLAVGAWAVGNHPSGLAIGLFAGAIVGVIAGVIVLSIRKGPSPTWQWNGPFLPTDDD